ncbi:hypothetical protein D9M68_810010 [compost metagenome]
MHDALCIPLGIAAPPVDQDLFLGGDRDPVGFQLDIELGHEVDAVLQRHNVDARSGRRQSNGLVGEEVHGVLDAGQ